MRDALLWGLVSTLSLVIGSGILEGGSISVAMLVTVFISNMPEAIAGLLTVSGFAVAVAVALLERAG